MFAAVYKQLRQMWGKLPAFVALVALTTSTLVAVEVPQTASAAIVTNNLVVNLDGTDTSSLAATSPTVWNSIAPGSSTMSGTITNATRATGSTGGLNFVGTGTTGSYVNFGTGKGNITGSITFDTWIKPGNLPANGWAIIASRWFDSPTVETTANHDFHFGIRTGATSGTLELDTTTQSAALLGTTQFPLTSANKWYHVGFVIDATSGKAQLFVNGVADSAQATMSHGASANPQFWLGDGRLAASLAFNGTISKARLYGAALSQSNLFQNFNADSTLFGYGPVNTAVPTLAGTSKVGSTLQTTDGSWNDSAGLTTTYKWQSSPDGTTWTDISGATSSSYTAVAGDAAYYIRSAVIKTNSNGSTTAYSAASLPVQTANGIIISNGGTLTGLTSTVPNDANIYQVTLASSNLSSTIALPNNTGLTIVSGYATTASYMATAFTGAPIISFRGTGTAINTALATATYTGTVAQTDTVKLYYARGTATITDTDNYIPIYDNGKLTFHYYTFVTNASNSTWPTHQTSLQAKTTMAGIISANKWYLATPRYQIEDTRIKALIGATANIFFGGYSTNGTTNWYWPANTDGFTTAVQFATGATATSTTFNGTSTVLPWQTNEPNGGSTGDRYNEYYYWNSAQGWDDVGAAQTFTAYTAETYISEPMSSAGSQGVLSMTVRPSTTAGAPTALSASAPSSSVTLNWTAPASTGADAITDYVIQYSTDQTNWTTFTKNASTATTATVTGLNSSTVYSFRVAAFTTLQGSWSQTIVSSNTLVSGGFKSLSGYSIPTNTTGTIRVLLASSSSAGRLWVTNTTNIDGGIRGTANYPDNNGYFPLYNYNPANINSAGQMIGLTDTSATDINTALASLRYQSPTASTDTISMWVSNGTEYVPILNGSNVEFHYYGKNSTASVIWTDSKNTTNAGASQTIDGVTLAAGTPFLATVRYRAENFFIQSIAPTGNFWLNASDSTASPVNGTEGTWKWLGPDANGVQFWSGSQTGSMVNGEYNNWGFTSGTTNQLEPNGGSGENCMNTGSGYANTGTTTGWAWNDNNCVSNLGFIWEAYNTGMPYGSNSTNPASSNYAALQSQQAVSVSAAVAAPTGLSASSTTLGQVDLSWSAPAGVSGITSYSVQYSTDGITWTEDRTATSTATTETITGLTAGTYYHFKVAAITSSSVGVFASTYFTPTGTGKWNTWISSANTVSGLSVDSSLNTYKMSVLLYASSSTIQLGTTTNLSGIRGTSNATTLTTAGQLIGLTGSGSDINTALASLKYNAPATTGNQSITMWVSVGTTTALPQAYVPVVNTAGQVEFHYYGYSNDNGPWSLALTKAQANTATINGQSVSGKYLATAESAAQNAAMGDVMSSAAFVGRAWLNGGDYSSVSSTTADNAWYWMGPDTGFTQFWSGNGTGGSAVNSNYYNWGASNSTTRLEPNGSVSANCLSTASGTTYSYAYTGGAIGTVSANGNTTWDDAGCNDSSIGYIWEYISAAPVGTSTSGANYVFLDAQSVNVNPNADAPTALSVAAAGSTALAVSWTAPATIYNGGTISGYQIQYSTSSTFATTSTMDTGSTATSAVITGLTANTTYYVRVLATGATWQGATSTSASATTNSAATTITVVTTGGGVEGTDYTNTGGILTVKTGTSASINASDIQALLVNGDVVLGADNVTVNASITWATSSNLTLGSSSAGTVAINARITGSGISSGVRIRPATYALSVKAGGSIVLSGFTPSLTIGGTSYTLIKSESELAGISTTGTYALAKPLNLTTAYTTAVANINFTGTFDGLGNTVSRMNISASATGAYGLFANVSGSATFRNIGVTNAMIKMAALSGTYYSGMLVGRMTAGTVTFDQVWSSGLITTAGVVSTISVGGIIGNAGGGTLTISKSWSTANIDTSLSGSSTTLEQGGIIGGDEATVPQAATAGGAVVYLSQVYSNGNLKWASTMHRGIGGLFGLHYNTSAGSTITDSFSWASMSGPTGNVGGAVGVAANSSLSLTRVYQASYSICVAAGSVGFTATPSCDTQQTPGTAVTGITGAAWASNNGTTLVNLPTPSTIKTLYVQPVYTANADGTFGTLTYQIVDGFGAVQNAAALTALNLSVSGTATYTIDSSVSVSATPYAVDYVSGLTLGGTAASSYTLAPWFQPTSATITKLRQTVNWAPTTSVNFGNGTFTPDALPVGIGGGTISYALSSAGSTGCTVNSSTGAITYTNGGSCAITATAAANGNYVAGSTTVTFTIADPATLPTVTARGTGTGSMVVSWTTPTVSSSVAITGYTLLYSTSSSMTSPTTVNITNTNTSTFISGLSTNTTYYFQVRAIGGSTWTGSYTTAVSGSTLASASTMTIAASGGATQGTGYYVNNGVVYATGNVTINASDINTLLANNSTLQLAADTVTVNSGLSWSSNAVLTLGNSSSSAVNVNSTIAGSGATAGVKILPATYALSVKDSAYIQLTGATPTFNLGGVTYTVVNTAAGLSNVTSSSTWALTAPITLTGSYTAAVKDFTFTGIMDGLGNTVNNMTIVVSATKDVGFYAALGGATVRNVGFTNVNISSATDAISTRLGSVAGNGSITASVTNTVTQVWATGFINQTISGTAKTEAGGLFGGAQTGTLNISKSWSSVAVSTSAYSVGSGGIIGTNVGSFSGTTGGPNVLTISESYSTGNILRYLPASPLWYGNAGIIGVAYGSSATLTNVFSWGNINSTGTSSGTSTAGISGVGSAASITNAYTTYSSCGGGSVSNCLVSQTAGSVVSGGTGFTSGYWRSVNGTSLVNVALPTKALYVQVVAPTDGSYGTMSYQIVDSTGTAQTLSSLNLTVSGTPTYTITAATAKGTYSVSYVSGLTLGGTSASVYSLSAWINSTSVTISKFPQTVTWTPTLSNIFGNGTLTPSSSASSDKSTTIAYSVASAGTTGCTVNASTGVITYTSAGTCTITASGDTTGDYLASTVNAAFVIAAAPTITIVASGGGISGTDYSISNGLITASANVSINASDLTTALASGNVQLAGNVVVNTPVTWSSNSVLTLGGTSSNTVAINAKITGSGTSAGVVIKPASYSLDVKSGAAIVLSGTTPTLSIGGTSYTLVKSIAELANVTASGNFALAAPLTYSSTLSGSPITVSFSGTFDGLGNTVDNMKIVSTAAGTVAFISNLAGGTVRNLGITNLSISLEPSASGYFASGALAGTTTGGTVDQVWSTGFIRAKSGSTFTGLVVGGLVGNSGAGTLTISKSWSSVNLYGWGSTFTNAIAGGLIGGDLVNWSATSASAGGNVTISKSYATGDIAFPTTSGTTGYGGIFGVHIGTSTVNVTDVFSWSLITINTGASYGGIFGNSTGTNAYLYSSWTVLNQLQPNTAAVNSLSNSGYNTGFGGTPSFTTNSNWYASDNGRQLVGLPMALKNFYVRVIAPTDGSYGSMTYSVVNGVESPRTLSAYGLSVSGTPTYTIASNVAISATPYNVTYVSGLTFSGTGTLYSITPYPFATSVTISKYPQTVTWAPTTSVAFSSGSITPSSLASASGGTTITYAVTDAGTTGCAVNSTTAVITVTAGGNCVVTATAANAGNYLAATASVTFAIADASAAPTGVTTTPVGIGAVMVNWTAPTPAATSALTGYQVTYSTSSSMTSPTTVTTSNTSKLVTGLTANTTYYFQVRAVNGTTWYGTYSTAVSGATPSTGTTLTVAATGGTQDTTWKMLDGVIYPIGTGIINATDLQGLLQNGSVTLAADTVTISSDVTWSSNQTLTIGYATTNTVNINADLTASGTSGGLVIAPATYSLDTKNNAQVILSGSSTTLSIGGVSYTLIRSIAGLSSVTATGNYALSKPLTFGTTALTAAPMNVDFTGTFDGLGNTFDGLTMTGQSGANSGLFNGLSSGSFVRNLGITNVKITIPGSATNYVMVGVLAGWVPSGQTGTATVNKVWTTGFVNGTAGSLPTVGVGGLVAWARSGTLNISQSWSSVNIDTSAMSLSYMTVGGLVGTNVLSYGSLGSGANVSISESYSSGNLKFGSVSWRGNGGLMGLAYATGTTTTVTDSFSYGTLTTTDSGNYGGIVGGYSQGTVTFTRTWTTQTYCGNVITSGCLAVNVALGTSVTGANTSVWTSSGASYLVNLPAPKRNLYVQVTYTNVDGSFAGVGNQVVDGSGTVQTLSSLNLTKSGTATYSIDATTAVGTYNVSYTSGLTFGGTAIGNYNFLAYPFTTSVAITKLAQSISFTSTAPTTAKVNTTYTPTATSTSGGSVTFTIDSASAAVCTISSGVVTFKTLGNCVINANQSGSTNYLAAPQVQQTAIVTVLGDQSITFTSTAPSAAKVAGATYTPTATSTSGAAVTFTIDSTSTSICTISSGVVTFINVGSCIVDADQAGNANWNAATQASQTFTVARGVQTITYTSTAPTTAVVAGSSYTPTATKTAGTTNSIVYAIDSTATSVCTIASGVVSFIAVGTCKVNANLAGDSKYEDATQVQQSFTVAKGSQVISFTSSPPNAAKVGGSTYTVVAAAGGSTAPVVLTVDSSATSKCSVSGLVVTHLAVGDCVLNLNQAGDTNYNAATQVQQTVTITSDGRCPNGVVSGNYCLIRFNSSGTWIAPAGVTSVDMLVVGGGGGGGSGSGGQTSGGGGGGGEVIESLAKVVVPGTRFTISVGAGGAGGAGTVSASATAATDGSPSSIAATGFTTITAKGGGHGGSWKLDGSNANVGASLPASSSATAGSTGIATGGGGSAQTATRSNAAGNGDVSNGGAARSHDSDATLQSGGGGGGAGGNGTAGTTSVGGAGGVGKNSTILNALLGGGGGGGKRFAPGTAGTATAGGGGGGVAAAGTAGTANTGGGGGGSGGSTDGASGGSGVVVIRIALQSQSVSFTSTAPTGLIYGTSTTYTPTVSGTASEVSPTITVDATSSSVCSISSGVVSIIGAGTCTLNANQVANGFFSAATQVQQSFTVAKQAQTISYTSTAPTNAVVAGATYTPAATGGGSTNAVTFTVTGTCSISSGVVSFTSVGTCTVKADQAGNSNYLAATQVPQAITVGKGAQTITFTSTAPVAAAVDGATYTVTATGGATGNSVTFSIDSASSTICSISGAVVSFTRAGACVVKANQLGNTNYEAATERTQTITVGQGTQVISFTSTIPQNAVVGGATYSVTKTGGASGNPVTLSIASASASICSIANAVVSFLTVGDCVVQANQVGDDNYRDASQATQTIHVGKGTQVIEFTTDAPTSAVVDGSSYTPEASGGPTTNSVEFSIASASAQECYISSGEIFFTAAGDCVVLANQLGDDNYNAAAQVSQTISVGKGAQNVTFTTTAPLSARVAGITYTPAGVGGSGTAPVTFSIASGSAQICEINNGEVSYLTPGDCVIELNQDADANYNAAATETQTITVDKGLQTITWAEAAPTDRVVDGATYTPTATGGASGNAVTFSIASGSASICSIANGEVSFHAVGDCVVLANQLGDTIWEAAPEESMTIAVGKGSQTINFSSTAPSNAVVAGTNYTVTATGGGTGHPINFWISLSSNSVCTIAGGVVSFVGVGTCLIQASQNGDANYEAAPIASQSFAVGKGSQSILFTSSAPTNAVVGGTKYTPSALGGNTGNSVTFSIASAATSICSITAGKVSYLSPGDCVIEANQAGTTNYNAANTATQTVTVAKGSQAITFTSTFPGAKVGGNTYVPTATGGPSGQAVTFTVDSAASSICSISNGVVSFQAVGNCVLNSNQAGNNLYNAAPQVQQTIVVAKGTQVVTFTSETPHDAQVEGLTYIPTATGSASGISVVFSVPQSAQQYCTIANGVVSFHAVGNCVLYANQAGNANWNAATQVSQIFDVTKGQQVVTITSTAPTDAKVDGVNYALTSTRGSGTAPVVYSISQLSTDICSVSGNLVSFDQAGDCVVVASQDGDSRFNPANPVTQTISVAKGVSVLQFMTAPTDPKVDDTGYEPHISISGNTTAIAVSTSDASVCEFVQNKILFHKAASCTVLADQAGNANYEAAAQISQTFTVAKGNQAPLIPHTSIESLSLGDGNAPTTVLSMSGGSGVGANGWSVNANSVNICSITDDVILGLAVGVCEIDLLRLGDDNYEDATGTLQISVSSGNQAPVTVRVSNENATFAPGLELTLSLLGGAGDGAVWYASNTPEICITDGSDVLQVLHAGECVVVGHKDGNGVYLETQDSMTFQISKASMSGVAVALAHNLTYSSTGSVSSAINVTGVASTGIQTLTVSAGSCAIENGELVATEAGACDVDLSVEADQDYLDFSSTTTFTVAKAQQSNLTSSRMADVPSEISYVGTTATTFEIHGGSGNGSLELSVEDSAVCSAALQGENVNINGHAVGVCRVTVRKLGDDNYASAQTTIEQRIYALPAAPNELAVTSTGVGNVDGMGVNVTWTAPTADATRIPRTGYQIQVYLNETWTDVTGGLAAANATTQTIRIPAWSTIKLRVAAVSPLDPTTDADRDWTYFTGTGTSDQPVEVKIPGELRLISTAVAAVTSGETVTLTGTGFEVGLTTQVELTSSMQVFTARIGAAAIANRVLLPATVISPTQLTFVLPKIKLPTGQTMLATQVKVLSNTGISSLPATFNYIPKKLTQILSVTPALPAATTVVNVGSPLTTASVITSTGLPPVITATPAGVCTATLNEQNRLVITPVSPGKCSISVQLPGTPGYTASAAKATTVTIKQTRSTEFMVGARGVNADGSLADPRFFTQANTLLVPGELNVVLGENPIEIPVGMQPREGTVLFTVDAADETAGRCTADSGDVSTNFGAIVISDLGDCHVTISNPADAGWYAGHTVRLVVHVTARPENVPAPQELGDGTVSNEDTDLNPLDPDTEPAVAIDFDPTRTTDYSFGGEDGLGFDPVSKKLIVKSRTPLVGVWTATLTSPSVDKKWFKIPGKIVKKVQTYTYSNVCKLTLTVKKDKKIKKKVTRIVGAGCLLTTSADKIGNVAIADNGWNALNAVGIQKIKVKYKRIRQYADTGLSFRGTAKAKTRILKNMNRTWVIRVGRRG